MIARVSNKVDSSNCIERGHETPSMTLEARVQDQDSIHFPSLTSLFHIDTEFWSLGMPK